MSSPGSNAKCTECGSVLPEYWPQGLCVQCALSGSIPEGQPNAAEPSGPQRLGNYELLDELARGGMGVVYRARQPSLNRTVALKLLILGANASPRAIGRLRAEAVAAAALKHPNIVAIHEVGVDQGQHYLVMDFIQGQNLAQVARDGGLPSQAAAEYLRKIAGAVVHAHERGILHRDLKPANVLLDLQNEPYVTDFGLAKWVADESSLTRTGEVLGSPNYMAPEQARGDAQITAACDIYGLGAVLYHLLTGRAPILGENVPDTLRRVVESEPIAPGLLNPSTARDLQTICLKCLEKEPAKRYSSAREVADELDRFLRNEPIKARPLNTVARTLKWARRHRVRALALAVLVAVAVGSPLVALKIGRERQKSEEQLYVSNVASGLQSAENHLLNSAREALNWIESSRAQRQMIGWEARYLRARCRSTSLAPLGTLDAYPAALAFSPDDKLIASITESGRVQLWDPELRRAIASWPAHQGPQKQRTWQPFHALAFDKEGKRLFTGGADHQLQGWNVLTRQPLFSVSLGDAVTAISVSGDGRRLAAASVNGKLWVWDSGAEWTLLGEWQSDLKPVYGMEFLPDAGHLIVAAERVLQQWSLPAPNRKPSLERTFEQTGAFAVAPRGDLLASFRTDAGIRLWKLPGFEELPSSEGSGSILRFSPDGSLLAVAGGDGEIALLGTGRSQPPRFFAGHLDEVRALAFSHDGKLLTSAGCDQVLGLWDVTAALQPEPVLQHGHKVQDIRFLSDSVRFLTLGREMQTNAAGICVQVSTVKLWHLGSTNELASAVLSRGSPHNNQLSLGPGERTVAVDDSGRGALLSLPTLEIHANPLGQFLEYSSDARIAVFASGRRLGRADPDLKNARTLALCENDISKLVLAPDGKVAVTRPALSQGEFSFWDVQKPGHETVAEAHRQSVVQFAFSPDGKLLASASWDRTVGLWDVVSRRNVALLRGHSDSVDAVAFSPDGRTLASGAQDSTVRLWHVASRRSMGVLRVGGRGVSALAFSPDGQWLIGGGFNGILHIWRAPRDSSDTH